MAAQFQDFISLWKEGLVDGTVGQGRNTTISEHVRRYIWEKFESKCAQCGWAKAHPISGYPPLTIDHIDGNPYNSVEGNLRLLCPCCHALTPTYGSRNKGNGRERGRRLKGGQHTGSV